jgi:NAD(P)-dependent dehydrogenase (short-subunit alcohol dehydrogenase family)
MSAHSDALGGRFRLDGRTVLVTGGAGFLGRQWVGALLAAGARVVSVDRVEASERDVAETDLDRLSEYLVDITDPDAVVALAGHLSDAGSGVDVLVNNAAVDAPVEHSGLKGGDRFETFQVGRWYDEIAVGLTGAFLCSQVFGSAMAHRGQGVIVNIGSDLGLVGPDQRLYRLDGAPEQEQPVKPVTYSVIKTGIIGLTRYLATYWGNRGVRANVLCLGGVARDQPAEFVEKVSDRIPLGRMARADEYRDAMVFLCSDASSYMTGSCLVLDGGRTVW